MDVYIYNRSLSFSLLRYNLHAIKFTCFESTIQCLLVNLQLCHHNLILEHFYHSQNNLCPFVVTPWSHPQPQASINLLSISKELLSLDILYKWNDTICGLLWLASFREHNVF